MLSEVQLNNDLEKLTGWGTLPRSLVLTFVHEATHHWCFTSPVGATLAGLQLRAQRHAQELLTESDSQRRKKLEFELCEALIRSDTAEASLRPLAEGLALFAEFDALSYSKSSVISDPLKIATFFFGDSKYYDPKLGPAKMTIEIFQRARLDNNTLARKAGLLVTPLSSADGGYLLGYLAVRNLWLEAAKRFSALLNETDLAMMYIRSFFFDDMGLVATLLDSRTEELASVNAIINHINQRFIAFLDVESVDIESYQRNVLAREDDEQSRLYLTNLRFDAELYNLGEKLMIEFENEYKSKKAETLADFLIIHDANILGQRDIMYLGSLPVVVVVDQGGRFQALHQEVLILQGEVLAGVESGTGEGSLDLFFSTATKSPFRVITITRENKLVSTRFFYPGNPIEIDALRFDKFQGKRAELLALQKESRSRLDTVLANYWMGISDKNFREQILALVEKIYLPMVLINVPDNKFEMASASMRKDGFWSVLSCERELIEGAALLGLCCSVSSRYRPIVSTWFKQSGLDLGVTLTELCKCSEKYGLPEVFEDGDRLVSTL